MLVNEVDVLFRAMETYGAAIKCFIPHPIPPFVWPYRVETTLDMPENWSPA